MGTDFALLASTTEMLAQGLMLLSVIASGGLAAQDAVAQNTQSEARAAFEVASIKPSAPGALGTSVNALPGGTVRMTNITLKQLIVFAWSLQPFQISGGPAWLDSAHFDISAKAEKSFQEGDMALMTQSLLADRFQLKIHRETKEVPIYSLVAAKKDANPGPRLTQSIAGACQEFDPSKPAAAEPGPQGACQKHTGVVDLLM